MFYTIGGTATNGNDYTATGTLVSIPAGQTSATVTITPFADNLSEGAETMTVTIEQNNAYTIGTPNTATVTIADSVATVNVTATDGAASEPGTDTAMFTFTRTTGGNPAAPLTIFYTIGGTATNGNDYSATGSTVVIPANQTSATVTITPFADNLVEGAEMMTRDDQPAQRLHDRCAKRRRHHHRRQRDDGQRDRNRQRGRRTRDRYRDAHVHADDRRKSGLGANRSSTRSPARRRTATTTTPPDPSRSFPRTRPAPR